MSLCFTSLLAGDPNGIRPLARRQRKGLHLRCNDLEDVAVKLWLGKNKTRMPSLRQKPSVGRDEHESAIIGYAAIVQLCCFERNSPATLDGIVVDCRDLHFDTPLHQLLITSKKLLNLGVAKCKLSFSLMDSLPVPRACRRLV